MASPVDYLYLRLITAFLRALRERRTVCTLILLPTFLRVVLLSPYIENLR